MIKTRLVRLLSHAKKYIVYNILWQWIALLAQITAIFSIAELLGRAVTRAADSGDVMRTAVTLMLAVCIRFLCDRMASRASYAASVDVKRILRKEIYDKLLRMGASYREQTSTSEAVQLFRKITMKVLTMQLNSTSVMDIVAYGGAAVGMIVAASEFLSGNIGFAGALTIILLASEFFIPLRLLGSFFHIAMNGMAASDKIFKLLDMEEPVAGAKSLPKGKQSLWRTVPEAGACPGASS